MGFTYFWNIDGSECIQEDPYEILEDSCEEFIEKATGDETNITGRRRTELGRAH